jgi:NAD(P)-dependent dehydrogenase (short-subunit alcohol dehydrogenase family)
MNIFITGISRGLGKELVLHFLTKGDKVYGISRSKPDYLESSMANNFKYFAGSVNNDEDTGNAIEDAIKFMGKIDVLINNAAIKIFKMPEEITDLEYSESIQTNLTSQILICRKIIPHFLKNKSGKIINISSNAGMTSYEEGTAYCSSKAGLITYSQSLAKYLKNKNISVNTVSPPTFTTEDYRKNYPDINHNKLLSSEKVIKVIDYIIFSKKFITGKNFPLFKFKTFLKYLVLRNLEILGYFFQFRLK